ncbi:MAG: hypothetical protein ABIP78_01200 [Pyrinomonadaceae bacterium]
MKNPTGEMLNGLLREFVLAPDAESDRALETLYQQGVEPSASAILRYKLRVSLRADDDGYSNQIGLELLSEVKAALFPVLRCMRSEAKPDKIENFSAYVNAAALNAYRQYLRDRHPNRLRLRNKIRYILARRIGYAVWKDNGGIWLCGLAEWQEHGIQKVSSARIEGLEAPFQGHTYEQLDHNAKIISVIESIFEMSKAPIVFEEIVSLVWDSLDQREAQSVSETDGVLDHVPSKLRDVGQQLDDRQLLDRLWEKTCTMPLRHLRALFLNLRDENGDNLIALLPQLGIASIRQIAAALEYEPEDFAKLWAELPLDDLTIAERMGLTRQQVINLRQSARASLRRGMV